MSRKHYATLKADGCVCLYAFDSKVDRDNRTYANGFVYVDYKKAMSLIRGSENKRWHPYIEGAEYMVVDITGEE